MCEKGAPQLAARDTPREAHFRPIADTSPPNGRKTTHTSNSTSTLASQPAEGHRHIRIVE